MKYPFIRQHSDEDGGAACIAMVSQHYGRRFSLSHIREEMGTGQLGTTLLGLRQGAEALGFQARSGEANADIFDQLNKMPLPAILHWQGRRWVVFYGQRRSSKRSELRSHGRSNPAFKYVIADPKLGMRELDLAALEEGWGNGAMLLLSPDEAFYHQAEDKAVGTGRFLKRLWPFRGVLLQIFIYALFIGLLSLVTPFLIQFLTDNVLLRGNGVMLTPVAIAVMICLGIQSLLRLVQGALVAYVGKRLELGLSLNFGHKLLQLPLKFYETRRSGEIVSRLEDITTVNKLVAGVVIDLPGNVFTALVSLAMMLFYSYKLALVSLVIAGIMAVITLAFVPLLEKRIRRLLVLGSENHGVLAESFTGAMTVKTTAAQPQLWDEFQRRLGHIAGEAYTTTQLGLLTEQSSSLVSRVGLVGLLWLGSTLVIRQELTVGQLLAFGGMHANFIGFIAVLVSFVDRFIEFRASMSRFDDVLSATEETQDDWLKPTVVIPDNADIHCQDVQFHYPGHPDLLERFSLTIPGGKVTALVGASGCGKSTLVKILAGLHHYNAGEVTIGPHNLRDVSLDSLRQQVVLVPQRTHFWSRSILDNFQLCVPHLTAQEIMEACQMVDADDFIQRLPDGYHTVLGESGSNLSGGQLQRLAIARALVMQPAVLILDESTSGLDPLSEATLLSRLLESRRDRTTILISHRPSVVRMADWVTVIKEGAVEITGTPAALLSQDGEHLSYLRGASDEGGGKALMAAT